MHHPIAIKLAISALFPHITPIVTGAWDPKGTRRRQPDVTDFSSYRP
jgi:hypothetical protein